MKNWIRIGNHYINLDTISEIVSDAERIDWNAPGTYTGDNGVRDEEPCVIFIRSTPAVCDGAVLDEIVFFGEDREKVLRWLENEAEMEVTNLNFAE